MLYDDGTDDPLVEVPPPPQNGALAAPIQRKNHPLRVSHSTVFDEFVELDLTAEGSKIPQELSNLDARHDDADGVSPTKFASRSEYYLEFPSLIHIPETTCTIQQYSPSIPHATILDSVSTVNTLVELDTHLTDKYTGLCGLAKRR
ncbi:hypothetical protein B0H14DRAFT_2632257 [Mycena olivaceomarginata]|nr:hypothetical protein B0H14DRAFT_2632257 [Mycena olivaceomarginata]